MAAANLHCAAGRLRLRHAGGQAVFTVTKYPQGAFSWVDCSTSDAHARHFYAGLLGWDIEEAPMGGGLTYYTFLWDGHRIAALSELPPQMAHLPPSWNSYVTVDDVAALASGVRELGGTVLMEPFDIFAHGRLLRCQDPQGATISFWQPINQIGAGLVNTPVSRIMNQYESHNDSLGEGHATVDRARIRA